MPLNNLTSQNLCIRIFGFNGITGNVTCKKMEKPFSFHLALRGSGPYCNFWHHRQVHICLLKSILSVYRNTFSPFKIQFLSLLVSTLVCPHYDWWLFCATSGPSMEQYWETFNTNYNYWFIWLPLLLDNEHIECSVFSS